MEHCSLPVSGSEADKLDPLQAGTSNSSARFQGEVGRFTKARRPAKVNIGEGPKLVHSNSKNATETELQQQKKCNLSEKPRMMKRRYAKMQPNLKSVEKSGSLVDQGSQKSSSVVAREGSGKDSMEDMAVQQTKKDTEIPSTFENSRMEAVSTEDASKEPVAESIDGIHLEETKTTEGAVTGNKKGKVKSRYLKIKPNLIKRTEKKTSKVRI